MMTVIGGFVHSGSGKSRYLLPERFTGHVLSLFVFGSPHFFRKTIFCHPPASPQSSQTIGLS
jgi:hypothetical protein